MKFAILWDFGIAQLILAMLVFNLQVCVQGLTYLEFRNEMDWRIYLANSKAESENPRTKPRNDIMLFNYGFSTWWENVVRVMRTNNIVFGFLFITAGE